MHKIMSVRDVYKLFSGCWDIYRCFAGKVLSDNEWQQIIDKAGKLNEVYGQYEFGKALVLAMLAELDEGDKHLKRI